MKSQEIQEPIDKFIALMVGAFFFGGILWLKKMMKKYELYEMDHEKDKIITDEKLNQLIREHKLKRILDEKE